MRVLYIHKSKIIKNDSIEKVFDIMNSGLDKDIEIIKHNVPSHRANLKSIMKNIRDVHSTARNTLCDIVHIAGDLHYLTLALPRNNTVLTIHDLVGLTQLKGFKRLFYKIFWIWLPTLKCKHLVAITKFTREDVYHYAPWTKGKIEIIPSAVNNTYTYTPKVFNKECPTLLMVGTRSNKNVDRVIEALSGIKCTFEIVGKLSEEQVERLKDNQIDYRNGVNLSEEELVAKYKEADAVLFPSTYEGQGVIILEAQKIGRAVLTSNIEPMLSVAGGAACLVDPYDVTSIRSGILRLIEDDNYRNGLIEKGKDNIKEYEAPVLAAKYMKVYERIIEKN